MSTVAERRSRNLDPTLNFTLPRTELKAALGIVGRAISGRSTLPIYSHVVIEGVDSRLRLIGSDGELTVWMEIDADVDQPGAITANAKMLGELVNSLTDPNLTLSGEPSHGTHLVCGRSKYRLLGLPVEDYPNLPEIDPTHSLVVPQTILRKMIPSVSFAVSTEEVRPILTGVLFTYENGKLTMAATDTHRLAVRTVPVSSDCAKVQAIIPLRALTDLRHLLTDNDDQVEIRLTNNAVLFALPDGINVHSVLIQGSFPNYQRVVPTDGDKRLTIDRYKLLAAVKRAHIVSRNAAHRILLKTSGETLLITAESSLEGAATEDVEIAREGEDITIAFNAKYTLDALNAMDSDSVVFALSESLRPALVTPVSDGSNGEYFTVLMPMQII